MQMFSQESSSDFMRKNVPITFRVFVTKNLKSHGKMSIEFYLEVLSNLSAYNEQIETGQNDPFNRDSLLNYEAK